MSERLTGDMPGGGVREGAPSPAHAEACAAQPAADGAAPRAAARDVGPTVEPAAGRAVARDVGPTSTRGARVRSAALFAGVAVAWLAFDMLTKAFFNAFEVGELIGGPYLGLFEFRLVHNTGAAWGMFGDSTFALGVLSVAVCAMLVAFLLLSDPPLDAVQAIGLALVFAGGVGNAIDRFSQSYVVDFINATFIDFPVFNIADIGVTCGFVVFFVGFLVAERTRARRARERS